MNFPTKLLACFTILLSSVCSAEPPSIIITDQGYFLLVLKDGLPEIQKPFKVIDTRQGDSPEPSPSPEEPDVSPNPDLTKKAKDWAKKVNDPSTAQALALVYRQVQESALSDGLSVDAAFDALREATDNVLAHLGTTDQWKPFRDSVSSELATQMAKGKLDSAQLNTFLLAIAFGLELAADGSEAINFPQLIEIVNKTNQAIDRVKQ